MDLFEYQGKSLYQDYDISHPKSSLVKDPKELQELKGLSYPVVVKAQVQVGGRGKAGGIKVANNHDELIELGNQIYGMDIKGHKVEVLLIEEASEILEEYYLSFTLDRSAKKYLMMLSSKGGMDIEQVAKDNPKDLVKLHISPSKGLDKKDLDESIIEANLNQIYKNELSEIISKLYELFEEGDCDLVEVNPLAITNEGVVALDSKVALDMNAKMNPEMASSMGIAAGSEGAKLGDIMGGPKDAVDGMAKGMKQGMNLGEVSAAMGTGIDPGKAIGSVAAAAGAARHARGAAAGAGGSGGGGVPPPAQQPDLQCVPCSDGATTITPPSTRQRQLQQQRHHLSLLLNMGRSLRRTTHNTMLHR